mmetsp:Transcript_516/g.1351  ORF Transcript_516/g.1351 Transcript_516/m.1351 type:complete len:152 (-) Transcript_516:196-651(-)
MVPEAVHVAEFGAVAVAEFGAVVQAEFGAAARSEFGAATRVATWVVTNGGGWTVVQEQETFDMAVVVVSEAVAGEVVWAEVGVGTMVDIVEAVMQAEVMPAMVCHVRATKAVGAMKVAMLGVLGVGIEEGWLVLRHMELMVRVQVVASKVA